MIFMIHITEVEAKGDAGGPSNHLDAISTDTAQETRERQSHLVSPLQNEKSASGPSVPPSASVETWKSLRSRFPDDTKERPISLATFMGGRAAGPRLNKHPPQDVYHPTTSQQRNFDRLPHPILGGGGVPLPGMARSSITPDPTRASEPLQTKVLSIRHQGDPRAGTVDPATSTPLLASPGSAADEPAQSLPPEFYHSTPAISVPQAPPASRVSRRTVDGRGTVQARNPINSPSSRVTTPSLSRPIIPEPRPSPSAPQISASNAPSKAFLRPQAQKEVTPSISRLQGRGFVRSMVNVSAGLESQPAIIKETERTQMTGGKRFSVLDRWQPNASPKTTIPSESPTPPDLGKSATNDSSLTLSKTTRDSPLAGRTKSPKRGPSRLDRRNTAADVISPPVFAENTSPVRLGSTTAEITRDSPLAGRTKSPKGRHSRLDRRNTAAEVISIPVFTENTSPVGLGSVTTETTRDSPLGGRTKSPKGRPPRIDRRNTVAENTSPVGLGSATTLHVYKPNTVQAKRVDELGYHTEKNTPMALPAPSGNPLSHVRSFR